MTTKQKNPARYELERMQAIAIVKEQLALVDASKVSESAKTLAKAIVELNCGTGCSELSNGNLAGYLDVSERTIRRNLKELLETNLIERSVPDDCFYQLTGWDKYADT